MVLFQNEIFEQMACAFDGILKSQASPGEAVLTFSDNNFVMVFKREVLAFSSLNC
jgi:hypothetical protein